MLYCGDEWDDWTDRLGATLRYLMMLCRNCRELAERVIDWHIYRVTFNLTRPTDRFCVFRLNGRQREFVTPQMTWTEHPELAKWLSNIPKRQPPLGMRYGEAIEVACGRFQCFEVPPF